MHGHNVSFPHQMNNNENVAQLLSKVDELKHRLADILQSQQTWFKASDVFNSSHFYTKSDELKDYLKELEGNVLRLRTVTEAQHAEYLTERISVQFSCFRNFTNSSYLSTKYKNQNKQHFSKVNRIKQLASKVTQSSQELYQELSKLQEYERRLIDMVNEKQNALNSAQQQRISANQKAELQNQVLVTHQRLGRCRKAISGVEEQIQKLDSRQS